MTATATATVRKSWPNGHTDHDLLAWNASQISTYYRKALLIVESNTIETERTEGENSGYILDEIADYYDNVYYRRSGEGSTAMRPGFHTNRQTKPLIVNNLVAAVRDGSYTERDSGAVDELQTYERKPNGTFGAKDGHHDDILMTRCIGLFIAQEMARNGGATSLRLSDHSAERKKFKKISPRL